MPHKFKFGLDPHHAGLLVLRLGLGAMFLLFGWPKLSGGWEKWTALGGAMSLLGVHFWPTLWGLLASAAEFGGGLCLILGVLVRPASLALAATMFVAANMHLRNDDAFAVCAHPINLCIVFVALALLGAGRYSLTAWVHKRGT